MISPLTIPSNLRFPNLHPHPVTPLFPYPTLFRSVSEHLLKPLELNVTFRRHFRGRCQFAQVCQILVEPLAIRPRSEEHTSELQSRGHLVCRLLIEKKIKEQQNII